MDVIRYFEDLASEFDAVKNRIRNLIGNVHWPTDGAWKESVLRTLLRKYLPPSFRVGSGFIITPQQVSTQIDILVCDDAGPILFRDGDFLVVTGDCVRAVIEVKTRLTGNEPREAIQRLNHIGLLLRQRIQTRAPFLGLFCYEHLNCSEDVILDALRAENSRSHEIRSMCFGDGQFYRYWEFDPRNDSRQPYNSWHAYELPRTAPGYFIHNVIQSIFPHAVDRAEDIWFPSDGKERGLRGTRRRRELDEE